MEDRTGRATLRGDLRSGRSGERGRYTTHDLQYSIYSPLAPGFSINFNLVVFLFSLVPSVGSLLLVLCVRFTRLTSYYTSATYIFSEVFYLFRTSHIYHYFLPSTALNIS